MKNIIKKKKICEQKCNINLKYDKKTKKCVIKCKLNEKLNEKTNKCVKECPEGSMKKKGKCEKINKNNCKPFEKYNNKTKSCEKACNMNEKYDEKKKDVFQELKNVMIKKNLIF